jgi:hypothetical protein
MDLHSLHSSARVRGDIRACQYTADSWQWLFWVVVDLVVLWWVLRWLVRSLTGTSALIVEARRANDLYQRAHWGPLAVVGGRGGGAEPPSRGGGTIE